MDHQQDIENNAYDNLLKYITHKFGDAHSSCESIHID